MKILLCCGGGFSSSYLMKRMQDEIKEKNLNHVFDYSPFALLDEVIDQYEIVLCCPHLKMEVQNYLKTHNPSIPLYLLPPRMYGRMILEELLQDAEDILQIYSQNPTNPVHFPNEENLLRIKRYQSYRHTYK